MSGSLPEMGGDWDAVFDETYLRTYLPWYDEERTRNDARAAVALAGVDPGADILDCPTGFGRHALALTEAGYRVTGLDRSETLLAEAERRRGGEDWPQLVRGDYRELPFPDQSFDAVLNLFTSLGYLERDEDVGVLRELRRVLRPGGALVVETMHRDGLSRMLTATRTWDRLPGDALFLQERTPDWTTGEVSTLYLIVNPDGERTERRFVHRAYSVKEWIAMLREAGFTDVEAFGGLDATSPPAPDSWRLALRAT